MNIPACTGTLFLFFGGHRLNNSFSHIVTDKKTRTLVIYYFNPTLLTDPVPVPGTLYFNYNGFIVTL